ncbi:type IV pilus modification protein PilV [Amphritea opalescens]|uniref:Type IV pilus modification protein PilV n=1 Tax=Amphritea opalescens TaxID=2490544 RepID=A0A430KLJ6_9GAMM|nr:type IV pilus modification protein PilV [Amphritea opalescens]RTE64359.1 type IV pilus modification protein PilV [Amphritea opalescens]
MQRQLGFSLIEVMIALVILTIGILGMAKLQVTGIQQNQSAYMRSQANLLAYDIIDRMRVNRDAIDSYLQVSSGTAEADCLASTGCSETEMAAHDLSEWFATITRELPSGSGIVCRSDKAGDANGAPDCEGNSTDNPIVVYLWWDDDRDGSVTQLTVSAEL